jgi:hypothetical protein
MKNKLLILAMGFALTTQMIMAQVPSYVPTNGLVAYWPFNENANDESGNGKNGTVNGAALTTDRFGNVASAYSFDGVSNYISVPTSSNLNIIGNFTLSSWVKLAVSTISNPNYEHRFILSKNAGLTEQGTWHFALESQSNQPYQIHYNADPCFCLISMGGVNSQVSDLNWHLINVSYNSLNNELKYYLDGILVYTSTQFNYINQTTQYNLLIGKENVGIQGFFNGKLDDIGIWNRALSEQEISNLYNSVSTNECLTMTINTGVLSTTPVTYTSSVSIYPNPANDQITIDCGNLANVVGWNIKITNMLGQEVFNQPMNTQQYVVPLNSWTGQGMYFVKIINAQNEVVNIKKIILQ